MCNLFTLLFIGVKLKIYFYCSETVTEAEVKRHVDDYLGVLTECLSEKVFICDYHSAYPVDLDLDAVSQVCQEVYPLCKIINNS
jgi:hypothetical protein